MSKKYIGVKLIVASAFLLFASMLTSAQESPGEIQMWKPPDLEELRKLRLEILEKRPTLPPSMQEILDRENKVAAMVRCTIVGVDVPTADDPPSAHLEFGQKFLICGPYPQNGHYKLRALPSTPPHKIDPTKDHDMNPIPLTGGVAYVSGNVTVTSPGEHPSGDPHVFILDDVQWDSGGVKSFWISSPCHPGETCDDPEVFHGGSAHTQR